MFDLQLVLGLIAGVLGVGGGIPYIRDILKGTTHPNSVSWFGWFLITAIASSAQFSAGASLSLIFVLGETLKCGIIFLLSLKYGVRQYTNIDKVCLALGILGIILWQITEQPLIAIFMAVIADFLVAWPTVLKIYFKPNTETASAFVLAAIGSIFSLASTKLYDLPNILYPIYLLVINAIMGWMAIIGQRKLKSG